jgi:hypothetical protein
MAGNTEHIQATIAAVARSVASEKKPIMEEYELLHPSRTVVNPRLAQKAGMDLDVYFQWNNYIRSGTLAKKVVVRPSRVAQVSFEGTLRVTLATAKAAHATRKLERATLLDGVVALREQIEALSSSRKIKDIESSELKQKELEVLTGTLERADQQLSIYASMLKKPEHETHVYLPKAVPPQDGITISMRVPVDGANPRFPPADMKQFMARLWGSPDLFLVAPEAAVSDAGKPKPLPVADADQLIAMRPQDRLAQASSEVVAWWYVILTHNHSSTLAKRTALPRALWFAKYAPASSPTRKAPGAQTAKPVLPDLGTPPSGAAQLAALPPTQFFQQAAFWATIGLWAFGGWHQGGADSTHGEKFPEKPATTAAEFNSLDTGAQFIMNAFAKSQGKKNGLGICRKDIMGARASWSEIPSNSSDGVRTGVAAFAAHLGALTPPPAAASSYLEVPEPPRHIIEVKGSKFEAIPEFDSIPEGKMLACLRQGTSVYISHAETQMERAADKRSLSLPPPEKTSPVASTSNKGKGRDPAERPEKKKSTEAGSSEKVGAQDVLDTLNPAKVVNPPRSAQLTDEQRTQIRLGLKLLDDIVPPAEWEVMDSKSKTAAVKRRAIPHWASALVLSDPDALRAIKDGEVKTAKEAAMWSKARAPKTSPQSEVTQKWLKLREKFKGESLWSNPATPKEKQFLKEFTDLKKSVGESASLPVPKERGRNRSPSPQRGRSAQRSATPSTSAGDPFDNMIKLMTLQMLRGMTPR